jgi:hypothetical protein
MGKLLPVSGVIAGKLTRLAVQVRDALGTHTEKCGWVASFRRSPTGPISAIIHWLDFADHRVARFRRSSGGLISAITQWLYSTDHQHLEVLVASYDLAGVYRA